MWPSTPEEKLVRDAWVQMFRWWWCSDLGWILEAPGLAQSASERVWARAFVTRLSGHPQEVLDGLVAVARRWDDGVMDEGEVGDLATAAATQILREHSELCRTPTATPA